jgi:hypothetical protein
MNREADLIVQCARAYLSPTGVVSLKAGSDGELNWDEVERTAALQSMTPVVASMVTKHCKATVSAEVCDRLKEQLRRIAQVNLAAVHEWQRVLKVLSAAGVSAISLKGPALALVAYQSFAMRQFTDLDMLVRPSEVVKARNVLVSEGYRLSSPILSDSDTALLRSHNRELGFVHQERGAPIELHWGVLHRMFPFQLPVDQLFESARLECRDGVSFVSLSPEYLLLYLCAHGTKHCWTSLRWPFDIACYVQMIQELNWEICIRRAEAANCDLVLKHSLLLTHQFLGVALPSAIKDYVCGDARASSLANKATSFLFREDGELGYQEALRYHLAFASTWGGRIRLLLERVFVPAEQDWQMIRLPRLLYFLYYAVRPIRFIVERFSTAFARGSPGVRTTTGIATSADGRSL